MLLEIKKYLIEKKIVPLPVLALHFKKDPQMIRQMVTHWIKKGKVKVIHPPGCGSKCQQCKPEWAEEYRWEE